MSSRRSRSSRPATSARRSWPQLSWDQYDALRFRPDHALWADTDLPFRVRFFHLGSYYHAAVRVFVVDQGEARAIEYDPSLFDYGQTRFDPPLPHDLGFAGWRLYFHTNFDQDIAVFLGASYFRATDAGNQYGMSCRGLAIDTALGRPEEFPRFSRFWLVRPQPTDTTLTAYALLESAERDRRLPLRHLARRDVDDRGHGPDLPAQADRAPRHRTDDQHVLVRRERAPRHRGMARGDPRFRRPVDVARQRRVGLAAADQPADAAGLELSRREPARLRPAPARPRLRPLPGRGVSLRAPAVGLDRAFGLLGQGPGLAGRDPDQQRDRRQHRGLLAG